MEINNLALLSGGFAERLKPITETIPKSMINIAGKPFIQRQIELLKSKGIEKIAICAGHLGVAIKNFLKDGSAFDIKIEYSFDGEKPLGTGGAIKNALKLLDDKFFILYGDSYLDTDYKIINEYFLKKNAKGLMTVFRNEGKWDTSNIEFNSGRIINYDKKNINERMNFIDYGLGILTKESFAEFEGRDAFDLEEVYQSLLRGKKLEAYEVSDRFYEIGSFNGLKETTEFFIDSEIKRNQLTKIKI